MLIRYARSRLEYVRQEKGHNEWQARVLSGIIACLCDDFAVLTSPKGAFFCQSGGRALSLVIYEKPQSICGISFANECQNDVVLWSFNVSHGNALHGTGSDQRLCPCGETGKLVKVRNCVTNVGNGLQ